ncbi:MAG TPA: protein kinase [Gemmatimonadaceae bacterium]
MSAELRGDLQTSLGGAYTLERDLGGGGMSRVFVARDEMLGRDVVVKVLDPELARTVSAERFAQEIRIAARLQEPHIVPVLSAGITEGGLPYYAMPFVRGESLRQRLERSRVGAEECRSILVDVAKALAYAHRAGVVHRDIKPENILLNEAGTAVVADFGIARAMQLSAEAARMTATGVTLGTPAYMAPEQVVADPALDHRADLYALGLVAYEMLAGRHPFAGRSPQAMLSAHVMADPPRLDGPPPLAALVMRLLEKEPSRRPAEAGEVLSALTSAFPATTKTTGMSSVGVLPFAGGSGDDEYFSDGMTEELINALARLDGLRVAARTSSFATKGRNLDAREAGKLLGVGAVLEGSVRRAGQRLRVTAQLIDASTGFQLWSDRFDRELRDVFEVQDDIARAIVGALRVRLTGVAPERVVVTPTRDLEAYDLFLKGRFAWNQRTGATITEAVRCFEQAIARDPEFTRAYAGLAGAWLNVPMYTSTSPRVAWPKAKQAAEAALARDDSLADAHTSLAYGQMIYEWNWSAAERGFQRAIAADPSYATAHHWYADFLIGRGRLEEGLREMRRAHELDPLSGVIGSELGWSLHLLRRPAEAIAQLNELLRLDPNCVHAYFVRGLVQIAMGAYADAVASVEKALALGGYFPFAEAVLSRAHAALGDRETARELLDDLHARAAHEFVPPFTLAIALIGLGEHDAALDQLHRGVDERDMLLAENLFDPVFDPLRQSPRYAQLLARMEMSSKE